MIRLDICRFQPWLYPSIKGRGVIPDHEVPETWEDYMDNKNGKLEFVKEMIVNK